MRFDRGTSTRSPWSRSRPDERRYSGGMQQRQRHSMLGGPQHRKLLAPQPQHVACAKFGTKRSWVRTPPPRPKFPHLQVNRGVTAFRGCSGGPWVTGLVTEAQRIIADTGRWSRSLAAEPRGPLL